MESFGKTKVSLRGASAKEITRDALLEKAGFERAIRSERRRAILAAQCIQRVWRSHRAVCEAAEVIRSEWDAFVAKEWTIHQERASCEVLTSRILRPFLYFFGVPDLNNTTKDENKHKRFVTCYTLLLQSINSSDPYVNYCSLSIGSKEQQSTWRYQVHRFVRLSCAGLVEGTAKNNPGARILAGLAVRLLVALTDPSLWHSFKDEASQTQAKLVVQGLFEWIAEGNALLYPAVRVCILQSCPFSCMDAGKVPQLPNEQLLVASTITLALRPLHQLHDEQDAGIFQQKLTMARSHVLEGFCSCVLTIPFLMQRLPAAIVPALQHSSVLNLCLKTLETLNVHPSVTQIVVPQFRSSSNQACMEAHHGKIVPSAWALINVVTLAMCPNTNSSMELAKGLALDPYVKALCSLLTQALPSIEDLQGECEAEDEDIHAHGDDTNTRHQLISYLEPLCQHWHLRTLLSHSSGRFGPHSGFLKLPDVAMLYSILLTVFGILHGKHIPCPVLNVLAFTPGFLSELWGWLDDALGLTQFVERRAMDKAPEMADAGKQIVKGAPPRKEDRLGGSLSSRWASAVSKIKGKGGSGSDLFDSDRSAFEEESIASMWDIDGLKQGPAGLPKETLHVLTLFSAAYGHLLMILDDDEFYKHQVPFTLKQQRIIAASLNTIAYNGLLTTSKRNTNKSLMEAAIKCLNSLYGRDCRRSFCTLSLWLAPAVKSRPPVPAAARAYEAAMASVKEGDYSQAPAIGYVLQLIPHVIPFEERVEMFREFVKSDKMARKMAGEFVGPGGGSINVAIRRDHLVEDAYARLNSLGSKFKSGINVSFVNEHGLAEAGLDHGGLFKEFLTDLAKSAFDPRYGLFTQREAESGLLFPHPAAGDLQHGLGMIEFLGRIVGKAMYEGILLDYSFSHVFLWKVLGRYVFFDELSTLDPELHKSLMYLKHYEGDATDLALDFTVTEELFGKRKVVELRPGGANMAVTNENKLQYVYAMADYKLNRQIQPLINAFSRGLSDIIAPAWLSLFNAKELNQLLSGGEHDFDVDDLKAHTKYTGGFTENSRTVKQFWEVVREFEPQNRCALLKFVTSCSRAPLLGFKHLQPAFTIHKVSCDTTVWAMLGGQDIDRLPSASTCYNTLKLPTYKRISTLKTKLRYAIHSNAGFELS